MGREVTVSGYRLSFSLGRGVKNVNLVVVMFAHVQIY